MSELHLGEFGRVPPKKQDIIPRVFWQTMYGMPQTDYNSLVYLIENPTLPSVEKDSNWSPSSLLHIPLLIFSLCICLLFWNVSRCWDGLAAGLAHGVYMHACTHAVPVTWDDSMDRRVLHARLLRRGWRLPY